MGKLRALSVTSVTPADVLPDVPPVAEFVPDYEVIGLTGIGAPRGTPAETIATLNKAINAALTDPTMKVRLDELGTKAVVNSPAGFAKLIAAETQKWAKVIKFAGIEPE